MEDDKFKAMTDEQLVAITNRLGWITGEEGQAAAELYRRKKKEDARNLRIQKHIRNMTIAILIIAFVTLVFAVFPFLDKFFKFSQLSPDIKPHQEYNQPTGQNERKENTLGPVKIEKQVEKPVEKTIKHK